MSKSLLYSMKDVHYDNDKFRQRSFFKLITQTLFTINMKRECVSCSTGKFSGLLMIFGLACLMLNHANRTHYDSDGLAKDIRTNEEHKLVTDVGIRFKMLWRRAPRLPPQLRNIQYHEWSWQIFESFEKYTKVDSGGYASLDDVTTLPPQRRDKMDTFFLGETLKYLYLLFGDSSVIPLDKFIFNTAAHPFPIKDVI